MVLKSSRSRNTTATLWCSLRVRAIACRTRSANSARFARPVTGSWNAWWVSCSSNALRSLMSRQLSTMPPTCSSPSRLVQLTSNSCGVPSRCTRVHCSDLRLLASEGGARRRASAATRSPSDGSSELVEAPPDHSVGVVAEQPLDRRALVADLAVGTDDGDQVARMADQRAEARLTAAPVDLLGELGALEGECHLRGERSQGGAHGSLRWCVLPATTSSTALRALRRQVEGEHAVVVGGHAKRRQALGTKAHDLASLGRQSPQAGLGLFGGRGQRMQHGVRSSGPGHCARGGQVRRRRSRRGWSRPRGPRRPRSAFARARASAPAGGSGPPSAYHEAEQTIDPRRTTAKS